MRKLIFLVLFMNAAQLMGQNYRVVVDSNGYDCTFRGLCAVSEDIAWACGSKGTVAKTINGGKRWEFYKILDTAISEIRDIEAWDANQAVVLSVKGPAEILKTTDGGQSWKSVFKSTNPNSFLDGMAFWNKDRGIAFGDPID